MGFNLFDPIGNSIAKLLDIENTNELIIINNSFYHYFTNNEELKLNKIVKTVNSEKISIIGFTEFKDKYRNNLAFIFKYLKRLGNQDELLVIIMVIIIQIINYH